MRYNIGITVDYDSDAESEEIGEDLRRIIGAWPGTRHVWVTVSEAPDQAERGEW
jgi:hypothetical protein